MNTNQKGEVNELKAAALEYANKGIPVFPLKPGDKTPIHKGGFHNATTDPATISQWWDEYPNANIGMATGRVSGVVVLDVDNKGSNGFASLEVWQTKGWTMPGTRVVYTPNDGKHYYFVAPSFDVRSQTGVVPGIDVRGDGGYVVLPPSRLANGKHYEWESPDEPIGEAPPWLISLLSSKKTKPVRFDADTELIPNGSRNSTLIRAAGYLRRMGMDEQKIFKYLWDTNVRFCKPPLEEEEVRTISASAMRWQPAARSFPLTDSGNAELFATLNTGQLLYDHKLSRWLTWQQHWWAEDNTGEIYRRAKQAARERQRLAANLSDDDKRRETYGHALKSENRSRIEACLELAKNEPELSDAGDDWDKNLWLLGVENGVVDLKTGQLRHGDPSDRISLHAHVSYDSAATCPRWKQFMEEIFLGDQELISYVQRAVGYSLTGLTTEHIMFLAYGNGANGKSVMLRVLCELSGDYAKVTPSSTLDTGNKSAIPNDVAALVNRRLVWASETEQTSTFNEAKVKQLVHGDEITARLLYNEFFTFTPVAKFWFTVNDLPTVRDGSHGMWRSLHVIPFLAQFDGDKADPGLTDTLKSELPGILNWAIQGCLEWQQTGLRPPGKVSQATGDYQAENDVLAEFIASYCELGDNKSEAASLLYKSYTQWTTNCGVKERDVLTAKAFSKQLKVKFKSKRTNKGMVYFGLQVVAPLTEPR